MTSRARSTAYLLGIYLAFFASGAASLVAEVTWNRMLIVVMGNSLSAAAMIISVFMGGLGLGSWIGGRVFGRRRISLLPYVILETTIGLYVLSSPALFDLLATLFESLSENMVNREGLTLLRIVVSFGALLLPACLMGATFPAIVSSTVHQAESRRTARTGYLYSINTLGAAVGCFAAGYHLLFEFGVRTTLVCSFGLYVLAALAALTASLAVRRPEAARAEAPRPVSDPGAEETPDRARARFLYVATFAVGFVALAYEVLLTRLSILYLGNSVSVFPLVLTAFLIGTGVSAIAGTWLYGVLQRWREGSGDRLFGGLSLAAGFLMIATPYILLTDWVVSAGQFARFADAAPRNPLPILGIIVAPTLLIGALLPLAIRMLGPEKQADVTRSAATLYALNTAGGVIGAGLANHFLVPLIGIQGTILVLLAICAGVAAVNLVSPGRRPLRWLGAAAAVAVILIPLGLTLPDMMTLYAEKIAKSTGAEQAEVRLVLEGRAATVTVLDQKDPHLGTYRDMYLNGVEEASTRYWHAQLFKLLGILPVLVHEPDDGDKRAMVVAFGAGITAGSVLASDQVASLDVVDLNPDIEGINDWFTDVNGDVFHEPRFHFQNDDGRNYLVTCNKRYDVIVSDSTHPRAYDSWILYTQEFYRAVAARLEPGGVFAQWVPVLGSMQGELFRIHLNTFRSVFPNTTFWYVYGSDQAFLLATPEPLELDAPRLQKKLERLPEWFQADHYQIDTVARVCGFFWMDDNALDLMISGEKRINTDDFHYFDKQSAVRPLPPQWRLPRFQAAVTPNVTGAAPELITAIRTEQTVAGWLASYGFYRNPMDLDRAYCLMPANGNARYWMSLRTAGVLPDPTEFCQKQEIEMFRAQAAAHPGDALALNALADALAGAGQLDEALAAAERAVGIQPENGMILDTQGWILLQHGDTARALNVLRESARHLPDHPIVLYHLGAACHAEGRITEARQHLEHALRLSDSFPGVEAARELLRVTSGPNEDDAGPR